METDESTTPEQPENTQVEWVLCSTQFEDMIHIESKMISNIPIESNYKDISIKVSRRHTSITSETLTKYSDEIK